MPLENNIFKRGSVTYYLSSKFFPRQIRQDVAKLYSFLRVADDYVDSHPQNKKEFKVLRAAWEDAADDPDFDTAPQKTDSLNERLVKNMVYLSRKYGFETDWVDSFFASMQADLDGKTYASIDGSLWYVHGSAEVVGFMMARLMGLSEAALPYASAQGRAMQWINFIRDIREDTKLGRCYFPAEDLEEFGLKDLSEKTATAQNEAFNNFIRFEIERYYTWQKQAEEGWKLLPKRLRTPLETASDISKWIAQQIKADPMVVYRTKLRPKKHKIIAIGIKKIL